MPRLLPITNYTVYYATCSKGFNEWRSDIIIRTSDSSTSASLRFVDDPTSLPATWEKVNETGWSTVYLRATEFPAVLHLLQTEKPLYLGLYAESKRAVVQTGPEMPGEQEGV